MSDLAAQPIAPASYRAMFETEDAHWWFDGMAAITARLLDLGELPPRDACRALDAGCGTGRNLRFLGRYSAHVVGLDHSTHALALCRERGFSGRLILGSVNALPFGDASFDLITSFDVLMTAGVRDIAALAEFARVLRPGGLLFVRVPAFDWLRGRHDVAWRVVHRYRRSELAAKLARVGLRVRCASYANAWLFPLAVAKRLAERRSLTSDTAHDDDLRHAAGRGPLARFLTGVLASEAHLIARLPRGLPWGLSVVALACKPAEARKTKAHPDG